MKKLLFPSIDLCLLFFLRILISDLWALKTTLSRFRVIKVNVACLPRTIFLIRNYIERKHKAPIGFPNNLKNHWKNVHF